MPELNVNDTAPAFSLPASDGETISLSDYRNKKNVVLYFYPKDNTPGCTTEACGFRDAFEKIIKKNAVILGVSPDSLKQHAAFIEKFQLPFILLSDTGAKACQDYGVWVKKSMYGKSYMGVSRTTFVIGLDGKIKHVFNKVKPEGHEQEILDILS